ncbi:hypothetical protein EJ08DRAFT_597953 [Tothia fuscella]|uniref:Metallo-beta-lactamase domain-containing protein n=1 Tax=Tothia fuscella TaxID=1048955 RepID=A0A9P4TTZ0_9PEZI|nr:hypothetical protein EJ08DRAFT_597953 [Tothia fuscella]
MSKSANYAICVACGTQFDIPVDDAKDCRICDDPRQFVPPTGQEWTSLAKLREQGFKNVWTKDEVDDRVWFITSEPKIGIGQRAMFLQTEHGNILWDLTPFIDEKLIAEVNSKGGLKAIVISHPHFYNTHLEWAEALNCPVFISPEDQQWLCRADSPEKPRRKFITGPIEEIILGVTAIKTGGHFPGSLVLHWDKKLLIADSIMIVPWGEKSGIYHINRPPGTISFSFMWSYPNMIPLSPKAIHVIWEAVKLFDFETMHGGFPGMDVRGSGLKRRLLESMKIWVTSAGYEETEVLNEEYEG